MTAIEFLQHLRATFPKLRGTLSLDSTGERLALFLYVNTVKDRPHGSIVDCHSFAMDPENWKQSVEENMKELKPLIEKYFSN